jgi:hypothetical protein
LGFWKGYLKFCADDIVQIKREILNSNFFMGKILNSYYLSQPIKMIINDLVRKTNI